MSQYLAASIGLSDGRVIRIGPDEDQVGDIPTSFTFQTQIPGGYGPASLVIPRPPDLYGDDAKLFSDVVVYGEGMKTIYEGYVTGLPQQGEQEIQIQLAGWSTVLDRIQNFRQIFVDRDLSKWREPSAARRLDLFQNVGINTLNGPVIGAGESGEPSLAVPVNGSGTLRGEAWFDAGPGLKITKLYWKAFKGLNFGSSAVAVIGFRDTDNTTNNGFSTADDQQIYPSVGGGYDSDYTFTATTPRRYAYFYAALGSGFGGGLEASLEGLAVYGSHDLTLAGSRPSGVYGSQAIAYMVGATPLSVLPESIEASDFIIPHLSFTNDISLREAIEQINVLGGKNRVPNDWGVYENREFFWRTPGSYGKTWRVNSGNLSGVRSDGPDSVLRSSGVKVNFQNEGGTTRSVGPPNSFSDYETTDLLSIDSDNPAFQIPGYHTESVGLTSQAGAINIGRVILNERNRLNWRGDLELQGEVMDSEGKVYPVHRIRAGDRVIVQDDDDKRPRPINATTYNHDNLSLTASLGAVPDTLDSLLARLAAVTDLFV